MNDKVIRKVVPKISAIRINSAMHKTAKLVSFANNIEYIWCGMFRDVPCMQALDSRILLSFYKIIFMKYLFSSNYVRNSFGLTGSLKFEILRREIKSEQVNLLYLFVCYLFLFILEVKSKALCMLSISL